jgi:RND superfamily putative drug exporter
VAAAGSDADAVIAAIRDHLETSRPAGLDTHVTGTAAISSDYMAAIVKGTDSTTIVTIVLVVIILLLIYRAPLAALVPLVTIGAAFLVSRGVLGLLAAAGWHLSSLLETFVVVLVFGVGTDYAIFLISRFREEVTHDDWHRASQATVGRIGAVIAASAATVIVGLGSMAFADFGMIQSMGPAMAVAIFVTLIAGLTLTPALLGIFGHYLFWPLHLRTGAETDAHGFFARLAGAVSRRPGIVTVVLLVALFVPAVALGGMKSNFDVLSELPADSDARIGFDQVAAHLGRGKIVQSTGVVGVGPDGDMLRPASLARLRDVTGSLLATEGIEPSPASSRPTATASCPRASGRRSS